MNDASHNAKEKLLAASREKDRSRRLTIGLSAAVLAFAIVLLVALLDYWFMLPMAFRVLAMGAIALLLARSIYQFWTFCRRGTPIKEAALDAEAQKPGLGCEISTAAEYLSGERKPTQAYESELAEALQTKAATELKGIDLPYWKKPLRPALGLALILLVFLFFGVVASGALTAFKRATVPWSNAAYTQVQVQPGNIEIAIGKDVEIKSTFAGRVPSAAKFEWLDQPRTTWEAVSLKPNEKSEYVYAAKNVRAPIKYHVSGSDALSPDYEVTPYIPPEVKNWHVELVYPAYTQRGAAVQNSPEIEIVRASTAHFQIAPNVKLSKARLRFKELAPVDLQATPDGFWTGDLKITKDADYWVELADEKGHAGGNETPYHIKALPDEAPKAEIIEPGGDMRADASTNIPVKISVTDDFGLSEIKLVYHRLGSPEEFVTSARTNETNTEMTAELPLTSMGLKEYQLVAYHAEAKDNNTLDGPGVGKSQVYFVEITNEEGCLCKKPGSPGQKVNLLVVQKQIIADTAALPTNAATDKYKDLALRQKDARDFGQIYLDGMQQTGAPAEVVEEMKTALKDMENAHDILGTMSRDKSLPPEESALAHLYHLLSVVPEMKDIPPPKLAQKPQKPETPLMKVVLEAIKKKQKEQPDNKEIEQALDEARQLEQQASLIIGMQNSGSGSGKADVKLDRSGKSDKNAQAGKEGKEGAENDKAGQEGKDGKGKDGKDGKGKGNGKGNGEGDPKLAEQQKQLSKEAAALAEKLARMAGKDARVGHGPEKKMNEASAKMAGASAAAQQGDGQKSGTQSMQADAAINAAIAQLERILQNRPELRDVAKEDFPKQYEAEIAEYLKKLSYAE
jgi:hypothetical protein